MKSLCFFVCLLAFAGAAVGEPVREGVIATMAAPASFTIVAPAGEYTVKVVGESFPARVDVSRFSAGHPGIDMQSPGAGGSSSLLVELNDTRTIEVQAGTVRLLLSRMELLRMPYSGPVGHRVNGTLSAGECHAYLQDLSRRHAPTKVLVFAPNLSVSVYNEGLVPIASAVSKFEGLYSADERDKTFQICALDAQGGSYLLQDIYPGAPAIAPGVDVIPAPTVLGVMAVASLGARLFRRNRR